MTLCGGHCGTLPEQWLSGLSVRNGVNLLTAVSERLSGWRIWLGGSGIASVVW